MIRHTLAKDTDSILDIIKGSGQFDDEGLAFVGETLSNHFNGNSDAIWLTADEGEPVAVAYCAQEPLANGAWNLYMLWTKTGHSRGGHGGALVRHLEVELRSRAARLLLVETSGVPEFGPARAFYLKCGFSHEATIKNFFATDDDKLVFAKQLT